jgi:hypothetical protein
MLVNLHTDPFFRRCLNYGIGVELAGILTSSEPDIFLLVLVNRFLDLFSNLLGAPLNLVILCLLENVGPP